MPKFQNRYGTGSYGKSSGSPIYSWGEKLTDAARTGYTPDDFFETGYVTTNSVTLSGGTEKNQMFFSDIFPQCCKPFIVNFSVMKHIGGDNHMTCARIQKLLCVRGINASSDLKSARILRKRLHGLCLCRLIVRTVSRIQQNDMSAAKSRFLI